MNVLAVYDISSSSVAAAHVLCTDTTAPVLLASARKTVAMQQDINMQRFVEESVLALSQVVEQVQAADVHHPTSIQVVLASPWYTSHTRTIVYKKDVPFTCTKKFVDELVDREVQRMRTEEDAALGNQSVVVERQLSGIVLNGYRTNTPFGKHATTLELFVAITLVPKLVLERFTDVFKRAYGTRAISYTTSSFATFVMMRSTQQAIDDAVVVDIGEEITDIAFIKEGTLLYQHSFPVGTFELYRTLAQTGNHTLSEAKNLLETYRLGKLAPVAAAPVEDAIAKFLLKWQFAFREILEIGHYGFCLPPQVVVTADSQFQQLFTRVLRADEFLKHRCSVREITVTYLTEEFLGSTVRTADRSSLDVPLAIAALYAAHSRSYL